MTHQAVAKFNDRQWRALISLNFSKRTILKILAPGSVLDLGCGDGLLLAAIKEGRSTTLAGLDLSPVAIKLATERGLECQVGDVTAPLPWANNAFTNVLLIDVLEHMYEPGLVLKEAVRVAERYVYISVPNFSSLPARWQVLVGRVPENNTPRDGHVYWFTYQKLKELLAASSLQLERIEMNTFWENRPLIGWLMRQLVHAWPSLFALSFIVKARVIKDEAVNREAVIDYYDQIYQTKVSLRALADYERKLSFLAPLKPGAKLLDVGCGTGYFLQAAVAQGLEATGLEISPQALRRAREIVPAAQLVEGDGVKLPFADQEFDYVVSLGSLEHFSDVAAALAEMVRVTKTTGRLLLLVPNRNYLFWRLAGNFGTGQIKELLLDYQAWVDLWEKHDLIIERVYSDDWPARSTPIFVGGPVRILRRLIYRLVWLVLPLKLGYQFAFVCRKKRP